MHSCLPGPGADLLEEGVVVHPHLEAGVVVVRLRLGEGEVVHLKLGEGVHLRLGEGAMANPSLEDMKVDQHCVWMKF